MPPTSPAQLRVDARGAHASAHALLAISWLMLVAVGWWGAAGDLFAVAWAACGAWLFGWLAGCERQYARTAAAQADDLEETKAGPLITALGGLDGQRR